MKHLIDRVLELQDGEESPAAPVVTETDPELKTLLKSLQPRIRVFGCGGCGSNTVARLEMEGLFDGEYVRGMAINTDAQHLLRVGVDNKVLIGRSARGRGAGGDPEKGEQAAFESEKALKKRSKIATLLSSPLDWEVERVLVRLTSLLVWPEQKVL